jgi:hypothetical protein
MRDNNLPRSLFTILSVPITSLLVSVLLVVFANAASAYTIVFRDRQRVEVPPVFTLTNTTFTYEVAPGINKTVQLIMIDVAATERANNEAPGSFFKHAAQARVDSVPPGPRAERTLTNSDLEPIRQRRIESEKNYEKRRIELGLPSIEETRRRQALEEQSTLAMVRRRAAEQANDEAYWRSRANALRSEIITVDAQISSLRSRLAGSGSVPLIAYGSVATVQPFGFPSGQRQSIRNFGTVIAQRAGAPNQALTNTGVAPLRARNPSRPFTGFGGRLVLPYAFPVQPFAYGNTNERANYSLDDLLIRRAGLDALWQQLENEARIAKVPQVWLAP